MSNIGLLVLAAKLLAHNPHDLPRGHHIPPSWELVAQDGATAVYALARRTLRCHERKCKGGGTLVVQYGYAELTLRRATGQPSCRIYAEWVPQSRRGEGCVSFAGCGGHWDGRVCR